ncbi:MAG: DUF2783 domain-containing protein [Pseudomonadota bacterium]
MGTLRLTMAPAQADELYQQLLAMHEGCNTDESMRRNAKLILLLVNHIADPEVICEAVSIAKQADPAS